MSRGRFCLFVLTAAVVLGGLVTLLPFRAEDSPQRQGVIDSIDRPEGKIYLNVTLVAENAQPSDPRLSTGVADPSKVTSYTDGKTKILVGSPVRLIITRQNAVFSPAIGVVDQVMDAQHCVIKVDQQLLEKLWQDPADGNSNHQVGDYLKAGATVAIYGVTNY